MGNQSTSGIVEETKATNEAPGSAQEVTSPDELKGESQKQNQEDETKDFQENGAEADSHDDEADKSEKEVSEEHEGPLTEDCKTEMDNGLTELNMEEGRSELEMQNPNPNCTSTVTNSNCAPHEAVDITSELQEDQNISAKEIVETPGLVDTKATLDTDDRGVEKKGDDSVVADTASAEGALLEPCAEEEELCRNDDPPEEELSNSSYTLNDLPSNGLLDSSVAENEKQTECWALAEEKLVMNESGNGDGTGYVNQTQPLDQEISQFLVSCSKASTEMNKSDIKENGEEHAVETDSLSRLEIVDLLDEVKAGDEKEGSIAGAESEEGIESTGESILEKAVVREGEPSATENEHGSETETIEKCALRSQSSMEIDGMTECEPAQNARLVSSTTPEAGTPPSLSDAQYSDGEMPILEDAESKARGSVEMLDIGSNPSCIGVQVELRKSPSFDFGLSFDTRSEESDQTPLLYQDRTPMRSFSSCSTLRFQNRSVQTECMGKSLHCEAVEVEEKTIRMERSNSESSMAPPPNLLNKEGKSNFITKAKQENSASDRKQENGVKASPSRDDDATASPRGNGKRKPRSSLFTTCICCTAAIS